MRIRSWGELTTFAESWRSEALSKLIGAERMVALNPGNVCHLEAQYFSAGYFPGLLQTKGYVDAMCRGHMAQEWVSHNITLRMARQRFMSLSRVMQRFLVHESVLTYRPNGFSEVVRPQLAYALAEIKKDMSARQKTLEFRIIPNSHMQKLPPDVHRETFSLYCLDDKAQGFVEPWNRSGCELQVTNDAGTAYLQYSWDQLGSVALSPADSLDCMHHALRNFA